MDLRSPPKTSMKYIGLFGRGDQTQNGGPHFSLPPHVQPIPPAQK